jgi:hypothetical protein
MHKVGGRDRDANIIVDVYRCHPVKGCSWWVRSLKLTHLSDLK